MSASVPTYQLAQLAALCDEHPVQQKIVFVPSRQIGYNVGSALALSGRSWLNLHLTTTSDWAERIAGPMLRSDGWKPLVQDADLFFVQALLRDIEWPDGHPFRAGLAADGVARTFLKTLRTLRAADVDAREVDRARLRNRKLIAELYRAYVDWLRSSRLYDRGKLFATALEEIRESDRGAVALFDETSLSCVAYRFVIRLSGGDVSRIGRASYDVPVPQQSAARRFADVPILEGGAGRVHPAGEFAGGGLSPASGDVLRLREAVGLENEVRGVLRELLGDGVPVDGIEITYTTEDPYLRLLVSIAERLDIPTTYASGVPADCTSVGQSLRAFYGWIASGYDPAELVRMCRSRLLAGTNIEPTEVARLIEEARVGRGHGAYRAAFNRLENRLTGTFDSGVDPDPLSANGQEPNAKHHLAWRSAKHVREVLDALHDVCPAERQTPLAVVCHAGIQYLDLFAPSNRSERDVRAAESLRDRLEELAEGPEVTGPTGEIARGLRDLISEHKVEASVARPGHLYVVPLDRGGYAGREHTVVVGLAETSFPGAAIEDPILLDEERLALSGELRLERNRTSEVGWHLVRTLGLAQGCVTLVSNRRTIAEGRDTYPSAMFQQIADQLGRSEAPVYYPAPAAETALDETELVLAVRNAPAVAKKLEAEKPWLHSGRLAEHERRGSAVGRYNGWIGRSAPELRPGRDTPVSASRLEDLAACPYRYFLKHVLGVRPPEQREEVPGRWLTPLEFGSLLHKVLCRFMEGLAERGERVDATKHASTIDEVVNQVVSEASEEIPVIHDAAYRVDVSRIRRAAHIFLTEESRRDVEPIGFEVSFGLGRSGGLNKPDPVALDLSESVRILLKGSIDRIDRGPDGLEVWDYKSGSTYDYDEYDLFMRGRRLQWALYSYALDQMLSAAGLEGQVRRSGYFFPSDREHGLRLADEPPAREDLARRIEPLFDLVEEGAFLHIQKSHACTFCDYQTICASERQSDSDLDDILGETPVDRTFLSALEKWMDQ